MKSVPRSPSDSLTGQVVITGLGAVCSLGNSLREICLGLSTGESGIGGTPDLEAGAFGCPAARVNDPPVIKTDIHPLLAKTMGKHLTLLLASTGQALTDAGIGPGDFIPEDMGFFAGMGMVDYHLEDLLPAVVKSLGQNGDLDYDRFFSAGYREIYPLWPLGMLNNVAFCQAAIHFGLRGENSIFTPHGDAGIRAVAEAVRVLGEGQAKVALAGGVSEEISLLSLARARLKGLVGPRQGTSENSRAQGASVFLGECGAMLVLETPGNAAARSAGVLARIVGFGFSCHRDQKTGPASTAAIRHAMERALDDAGIGPEKIDVVILGGCGQNESQAVEKTFGVRLPVVVSTAGIFGETFAAGPILNAALGLKISHWAELPQDIYLLGDRAPADIPKTALILVNGISYEGMSSSMIIEKAAGRTL